MVLRSSGRISRKDAPLQVAGMEHYASVVVDTPIRAENQFHTTSVRCHSLNSGAPALVTPVPFGIRLAKRDALKLVTVVAEHKPDIVFSDPSLPCRLVNHHAIKRRRPIRLRHCVSPRWWAELLLAGGRGCQRDLHNPSRMPRRRHDGFQSVFPVRRRDSHTE